MTRHVPISEFKDHASELVAAAERGEEIVITRHGRPSAVLKPVEPADGVATRSRAAMRSLLARRQAMRSAGMTAAAEELIAWKNEGRR